MPSSFHFLFDMAVVLTHHENTVDTVYPIYLGTPHVVLEPYCKNIKNSQNIAF